MFDFFKKFRKINNNCEQNNESEEILKLPIKIEPKKINEITISFRSGSKISFNLDWTDESKPKIGPWINFYKWYFGRKESKVYMFRYMTGETMILRDEIYSFNVDIHVKKV